MRNWPTTTRPRPPSGRRVVPYVNAQYGTSANSTGTVGSNTLVVGSLMNPVTMTAGNDPSAPYQLKGTTVADSFETTGAGSIAVTSGEVTAALRGQTVLDNSADFYKIKTPIGCIGPDVRLSGIEVTTANKEKMVYASCDPSGYKGTSTAGATLTDNKTLYSTNAPSTPPRFSGMEIFLSEPLIGCQSELRGPDLPPHPPRDGDPGGGIPSRGSRRGRRQRFRPLRGRNAPSNLPRFHGREIFLSEPLIGWPRG